MILYRSLLIISWGILAVLGWFFLEGLGNAGSATVSAANLATWILILGGIGGIIALAGAVRRRGRPGLASLLLAIIVTPLVLLVLFYLLLILTGARWN